MWFIKGVLILIMIIMFFKLLMLLAICYVGIGLIFCFGFLVMNFNVTITDRKTGEQRKPKGLDKVLICLVAGMLWPIGIMQGGGN